jgi:asparagine synthase (glutamine-hydrolysing)
VCGVAGIIGPNSADDVHLVEKMLGAIKHRGPDDSSISRLDGACLGHVRLAIVDLGPGGKQPVHSEGKVSLVFNGMLYNYIELKNELNPHYNFKSKSDTEVLLACLDVWGIECLPKLNGMFAFCAFNQSSKLATFARDRFGQKPLFYAFKKGRLFFASEIKALLAAGFKGRSNQKAWLEYLAKGISDNDKETFFEGIFQLGQSEVLEFSFGSAPKIYQYYKLSASTIDNSISQEVAAEKLYHLLADVVNIHMRSDVPVGVSLSGGFDSSALLALLSDLGHLSKSIKCLAADFGSVFSEKYWIEQAADYHNLSPSIFSYKPEDLISDFDRMMWHLEAPSGGVMNFALGKVMEGAEEQGLKVIHDGTGLDEAFAGYKNHHAAYVGQMGLAGDVNYDAALKAFSLNWAHDISQSANFCYKVAQSESTSIDGTDPLRKDLLNIPEYYFCKDEKEKHSVSSLHENLIKYFTTDKIPRNMRMKDRLSMSYGIELRLPFLDHRLIDFALSLPTFMYFLGGRSKAIVRSAMSNRMDESVRVAKKRSIQSPQGMWLGSEPIKTFVGDLIHSRSFMERPLLKHDKIQLAYNEYCSNRSENSFFIWQWLNYEMWHRTFID